MTPAYVGRFAPSPTGPLHFGSFVAALASFLDARHHDGRWLLRIEDLDPPRESPTAAREIIGQLEALGLIWDGDVLYQSDRLDAYQQALNELSDKGYVYPCTCSRREVEAVYDGKCRGNAFDVKGPFAVRLFVDDDEVSINDRIQGKCSWHLQKDVGDFIIKRKDGLFAYQLAVVIDDAFQQVTDVVRGVDLLDSTPRQMALARRLGLAIPAYAHIPVVTGADGEKLSKQTHADPVDIRNPVDLLTRGLTALGQPIPRKAVRLQDLLNEATKNWAIERIPGGSSVPLSSLPDLPMGENR